MGCIMSSTRRDFLLRSMRAAAGAAALTVVSGPFTGLATSAGAPKVKVDDYSDDGLPDGPFTSAPRSLPTGTTHVGIHWQGPASKQATLHARTRVSGRWSEWLELVTEDGPLSSDETFATLIDTRGASEVQYRVVLPGGDRLERVTVTTINTDLQVSVNGLLSTAYAADPPTTITTLDGAARRVIRRDEWGCDETLRFSKTNGSVLWPAMCVPIKKVVVHHTATSNRYTLNQAAGEVRAIYTYHAQTQGWGDIGYNSLADRFGNVYEGRRGRETNPREILSSGVVAGHTLHHNYGSTGVAVIGDFTKRKITLSNTDDARMVKALEDMIVYECGWARIPTNGVSHFLRSDDAWHLNMPSITGHKDSVATQCPGTALSSYLLTLRTNATNRLAPFAAPAVSFTTLPPDKQAAAPASLTFNWSDAGSTDYRLEGWRRVTPTSDDIFYITQGSSAWGTTTTEPAGWVGADKIGWTAGAGPVTIAGLPAGHYTLHVRGYNSSTLSAVEASFTVLVK
jgi:hypothetical protein